MLSLLAFALLACSTAFVTHLHRVDGLTGSTTADHCELCLQVTPAVAGNTAQPQAHAPLLLAYAAVPTCTGAISSSLQRRAHRARAPPQLNTTV